MKGAIWYQGEANAGNAAEYKTLFPRMISDWREKWGEGDFPFLFVQLASLRPPQKDPSEGGWAYLREAQLDALALPNTGMAVAVDLGNPRTFTRRTSSTSACGSLWRPNTWLTARTWFTPARSTAR